MTIEGKGKRGGGRKTGERIRGDQGGGAPEANNIIKNMNQKFFHTKHV